MKNSVSLADKWPTQHRTCKQNKTGKFKVQLTHIAYTIAMYNNYNMYKRTKFFREESSVAIEHSFKLSEMIAAYKTVMSALGIKDVWACRDHQLVQENNKQWHNGSLMCWCSHNLWYHFTQRVMKEQPRCWNWIYIYSCMVIFSFSSTPENDWWSHHMGLTLINYASVDGAPRHTVVVVCVCPSVFPSHVSPQRLKIKRWNLFSK